MSELRRHIMMQQVGGVLPLPSEYQAVEWIENIDGYALWNTGIIIPYPCIAETKCLLSKTNTYGIWGQDTYERSLVFGNGITYQGRDVVSYRTSNLIGTSLGYSIDIVQSDTLVNCIIDIYTGKVILNGTEYRGGSPSQALRPLLIGSHYDNSGNPFPRGRAFAKICKLTFTTYNNRFLADFIPCYRKSDMVPGFYELVSRQFITSQGGSVGVGPDV